jgi:hypothetical protein
MILRVWRKFERTERFVKVKKEETNNLENACAKTHKRCD